MKTEICFVSDDNSDRFAEDCAPAAAGAGGPKDRPLLGVRGGRAGPADGRLRAGRTLAGLYLVRNRLRRAVRPQSTHRVVGESRQRDRPTIHGQQHRWSNHKG